MSYDDIQCGTYNVTRTGARRCPAQTSHTSPEPGWALADHTARCPVHAAHVGFADAAAQLCRIPVPADIRLAAPWAHRCSLPAGHKCAAAHIAHRNHDPEADCVTWIDPDRIPHSIGLTPTTNALADTEATS